MLPKSLEWMDVFQLGPMVTIEMLPGSAHNIKAVCYMTLFMSQMSHKGPIPSCYNWN
jgi:hypothetical protein